MNTDKGPSKLILYLQSRYLVISKPNDFSRRATVVAQVEVVAKTSEEVVVVDETGYDVRPRTPESQQSSSDSATIESPARSNEQDGNEGFRIVMRPLCIFK
jgi:hypothetical protein